MKLRLRRVREDQAITQEELAAITGMSRSTISRLEAGLQQARISTVRKLAAGLNVEPALLIDRSEDLRTESQTKTQLLLDS